MIQHFSDLLKFVVCRSNLLALKYLFWNFFVELTQRYFVKIAMTELGKSILAYYALVSQIQMYFTQKFNS